MLTAPTNPSSNPTISSRQQCSTWVVKVLDDNPNYLIKKARKLANYKSLNDVAKERYNHAVISYTGSQM